MEYTALLAANKIKDALLVIREDNPLPSICGYVCHRPCENACVRGSWDDPVSIRDLKLFATRYELDNRDGILQILKDKQQPTNGLNVNILGSGPSGLACAYELSMNGFKVNVLDALPQPGGMLIGGIPSFRLPREAVFHDVGIIKDLGVNIQNSIRIGRDISFDEITKGAHSVVIATGAWQDLDLKLPGEDSKGIEKCMDFLSGINIYKGSKPKGKILVIGGGNAAIDAARSALRMGADNVTILYRRTKKEMPADHSEIEAAVREGVQIRFLIAPKKILIKDGNVVGLEMEKMKLLAEDGRKRHEPIPLDGESIYLEADLVITAIGQKPDLSFLDKQTLTSEGMLDCASTGMIQGYKGIFVTGDALIGPSTLVQAISSGKSTALKIRNHLLGYKQDA
jgi:NADH-quinone oxidoreductase subunit F